MLIFGKQFVWTCLLHLAVIVVPDNALLNLSLQKPTNQSSTHDHGISLLAVDGCLRQFFGCGYDNGCGKEWADRCCSRQAEGRNYAWWSVDLEQLSEISHIVVYFRWEPENNFKPFDTQGYIIRISNDTELQSGEVCYINKDYDLDLNNGIKNHTSCTNITGRYVHFANNRSDNSDALLELCEVQVFGCPIGTFGRDCSNNCSIFCLNSRCKPLEGTCFACEEGTFVDQKENCKHCSENCSVCKNSSICELCMNDFYLFTNDSNTYCDRCPKNCLQCEKNSGCTNCSHGYYLNSTKCIMCPANCTLCSDHHGCSSCEYGFALKNNYCVPCTKNCLNCSSSSTCHTCIKGYFLLNNECKDCPENCQECNNNGECEHCQLNYYKNITGDCVKCFDTCTNCTLKGCGNSLTVHNLNQHPDNRLGSLLGGFFGGFVLVITVVVISFWIIKKRKNDQPEDTMPAGYSNIDIYRRSVAYNDIIPYENETYGMQEENYYNMSPLGIPVSRFGQMVTVKLKNKARVLKDEFRAYESSTEVPSEIAKLDRNKDKNRFKQIFAYDHSRVVLYKGQEHDYINANYIDGIGTPNAYIATQGPKANTIEDFWFMIWQENCGKIIMLTNLKEGKKTKCEKYWPEEGHKTNLKYFTIKHIQQREYGFYVIRTLKLTQRKTQQEREIHQFHFTAWPDHGTPEAIEIVLFHRHVSLYPSKLSGPLCVHCSAGIGRTGTYIGLDALLSNGKKSGFVDVPSYLKKMRSNRMFMVQNEEQYIALHVILLEAYNLENTLIQKADYWETLNELKKSKSLLDEYKKLKSANLHNNETQPRNVLQNEVSIAALPTKASKYRVTLQTDEKGCENYVNAIFVPSYRSRNGFIVTQFPTSDTITIFWRMILEHSCKTIVMLAEESEITLIQRIIPVSETLTKEKLTVQSNWNEQSDEADIKLANKKPKCSSEIKVFCSIDWNPCLPLCDKTNTIFKLVEKVYSREQKYGNKCPTVIMSSYGTQKTGIFCLLYNTRNQLKLDGEVDVFHAARQLQLRNSSLINSYEEYEYCYKALQEYLNMTDVYVNT